MILPGSCDAAVHHVVHLAVASSPHPHRPPDCSPSAAEGIVAVAVETQHPFQHCNTAQPFHNPLHSEESTRQQYVHLISCTKHCSSFHANLFLIQSPSWILQQLSFHLTTIYCIHEKLK